MWWKKHRGGSEKMHPLPASPPSLKIPRRDFLYLSFMILVRAYDMV
jgi:hypothetical protein